MTLFPYEQFTIRTMLGRDEVVRRLSEVIGPYPALMQRTTTFKPYHGSVSADGFKAVRQRLFDLELYRPRIAGRITYDAAQTSLEFTVSADPVATFFTAFVLGLSTLGLLTFAVRSLAIWVGLFHEAGVPIEVFLLLIGVIVATFVLFAGLLKVHTRKTQRFFQRLLAD